jgi:hypothetical protein
MITKKYLVVLFLLVVIVCTPVMALENNTTVNPIPITATTVEQTPIATASITKEGKFRVPPVVKIRPLNDEITKDQPTLIEFYFSNPAINDATLTVEAYISVPSGVHIYAEGFSFDAGAGTLHGYFEVKPGNSRVVHAEVIGAKPGDYYIHAMVMYYPNDEKDNYKQISLTHPFKVKEEIRTATTNETVTTVLQQSVNPMWIILIGVILGGVAIIFAVRRRPPTIRIEE